MKGTYVSDTSVWLAWDYLCFKMKVLLLHEDARVPSRKSPQAAGYDITAAEEAQVPPRGRTLVSTGLAVALPDGCYGRIAPRSGTSSKHGIETGAGVIDADYRGEVKVLLYNHSDEAFPVHSGDRIAQLILEKIDTSEVVVATTNLPETSRGSSGFGSTGIK